MLYTAPEAQLLVVHSEGFVCASATMPIDGFGPGGTMSIELDTNSLLDIPDGMGFPTL